MNFVYGKAVAQVLVLPEQMRLVMRLHRTPIGHCGPYQGPAGMRDPQGTHAQKQTLLRRAKHSNLKSHHNSTRQREAIGSRLHTHAHAIHHLARGCGSLLLRLGLALFAKPELVHNVLLHPRRRAESKADAEWHREARDVHKGERLGAKLAEVLLVAVIGPVPIRSPQA